MNILKNKTTKRIIITSISIFTVIALFVGAFMFYANDYYHADTTAIMAMAPVNDVAMHKTDNDTIIYAPKNATTGFIFYPGGKVEYTAYIPLMQSLANEGVFCALVKMPFNLAVLDINAASEIKQQYTNITNWYIGGHSLGGSMAASYLSNHTDDFKGLILLGSYSTADLSQSNIKALSIYGSEDKVLNYEKYNKNKSNLPKDFSEIIINGGCHAYFGMYGNQDGDGTPTITNNDQISQTTKEIINFLN